MVIRLSAIGDIVMASPLVAALRRQYPQAYIAWLAQPESRELLVGHPQLDEVIVWPRSEWRQLLTDRRYLELARRVRAFRRELREHGFDLAIDLQGLMKSGWLAWLSGAPERVGLGSREGSRWLMTHVVERGGRAELIGSEYRFLAEALELPVADFHMQVGIGTEAERVAGVLLETHVGQRSFAVGCPFTTRPQKHWVEQAWADLARELYARHGLPLVLLGGPGDLAAARRIAAQAGDAVDNRVGETSLTEAAAVISRARLLVGVDTGLTHMGPAFNVPTVALFGSTCPYLETGRDNTVVIYHNLPCAPCKRNPTCEGRFDCLTGITVEEVLAQVERLLPHQEAST
ncbi:lipopolysaccharide heptosyltransferase II [Ectothiorhodospira sp. 9100]|uniref:lipopolysaccharide heptosyltransferase II n=1 Tax=unclassified Ectothiorhodospira TaxID=2684909 RepID=UPI003083F353